MIITISGLHNEWGGDDLSPYVDRTSFHVESIVSNRIDTCEFTIMDTLPPTFVIRKRAEIVIYDAPGCQDDPGNPGNITTTWLRGQAPIVDPPPFPPFGSDALWTPRLFGGYVSQPDYSLDGAQRYIAISNQDYTVRVKTTVCNRSYAPDLTHPPGWTDAQVVKDVFSRYLPDIDTTNVHQALSTYLPVITFPVHTIEQFLTRIVKLSLAFYRIDYYKRLIYGPPGTLLAPFGISHDPTIVDAVVTAARVNLLTENEATIRQDESNWWLPYNLLTQNEASIETDASGWSASTNCSVARSSTTSYDGGSSLAMTAVASGSMTAILANFVPIVQETTLYPFERHTISARFRSSTTGRSCAITANFYDALGSFLGSSTSTSVTDMSSGWVQASVNAAPPIAASLLKVVVTVLGAAAGEVHYVDLICAIPETRYQSGSTTYGIPAGCLDTATSPTPVDGGTVLQVRNVTGRTLDLSRTIPVTTGQQYTFSFDVYHASGSTETFRFGMRFFDDVFSTSWSDFTTVASVPTSTWTRVSIQMTVPTASGMLPISGSSYYGGSEYGSSPYGGSADETIGVDLASLHMRPHIQPTTMNEGAIFYIDAACLESGFTDGTYITATPQRTFMNLLGENEASFENNPNGTYTSATNINVGGWIVNGYATSAGEGPSSGYGVGVPAPIGNGVGIFRSDDMSVARSLSSILAHSIDIGAPVMLTFSGSFYGDADLGNATVTLMLEFHDSLGRVLFTASDRKFTIANGTWTRRDFTYQNDDPRVESVVPLWFFNFPSGGTFARVAVDALQLRQGPPAVYQDPNTPPDLPTSPDPPRTPSVPCEELRYTPDFSGMFDRAWIKGATFRGTVNTFTLPAHGDGATNDFQLPAPLDTTVTSGIAVTVDGVDQGQVGILGVDGFLDNRSGYKYDVLIGTGPTAVLGTGVPLVSFKTPPTSGAVIAVTAAFVYPLVQVVTDGPLMAELNNIPFEKVISDRRITTQALAVSVGQQQIRNEGYSKAGGSCTISNKNLGSAYLQPGQLIWIENDTMFAGIYTDLGAPFLINRITLQLIEDIIQPYKVTISFAERVDKGDEDIFDQLLGEQGRVNAALQQSDVNETVSDQQTLSDQTTFDVETITTSNIGLAPYHWDASNTKWGYFIWS